MMKCAIFFYSHPQLKPCRVHHPQSELVLLGIHNNLCVVGQNFTDMFVYENGAASAEELLAEGVRN